MKNTTHDTTVTLDGIDLNIEYNVHGKYVPATWIDPAEYPELEILTIKVIDSNVDIYELLSKGQINDIETQIFENYENDI